MTRKQRIAADGLIWWFTSAVFSVVPLRINTKHNNKLKEWEAVGLGDLWVLCGEYGMGWREEDR